MKTRVLFVLLILALIAVAVPVMGDHVTEPTAPVLGLTARLYKYTDPQNTMMRCDGTDRITFDRVRIEPGVMVTAKPSEHFTVSEQVTHALNLSGRANVTFRQWGTSWKHQNANAHSEGGLTLERPWEVNQTNLWLHDQFGFWIIEHRVTGEESGNVFTHRCVFEYVPGTSS